jgi:hypothetical protein
MVLSCDFDGGRISSLSLVSFSFLSLFVLHFTAWNTVRLELPESLSVSSSASAPWTAAAHAFGFDGKGIKWKPSLAVTGG